MAIKTLITTFGRRKIAQALANEDTIEITAMVFGDGDGSQYTPTVSQTQLKNQKYSTSAIATVEDEVWTYFEATIPSTVNGFTIREIGLTCFNEETNQNELIIVASVPDTEKAVSENGVQQTMPIRIGVTTAIGNVLTIIADPDSIPPFTNKNLGLIKGRVYDGYVQARDGDTGYGYVTGWDNVFKKISSNPQTVNSDVIVSLGNTIYFTDSSGVQQNLIDISDEGIRIGDKDTPLNLASTSEGVNIYSNWEGTGIEPRKILTEYDLRKRVTNYLEDITDESSFSAGAYKKVGNPTESEGSVGGFTNNDYIILDANLPENTSSEISTKFTTGSDVTTRQTILDSKDTFSLGIENGKFIYSLGEGYGYNVVGNPTITESELSNFSSSNYVTLNNIPEYENSFELLTKFTTGSDVTTRQTILDSRGTNSIGIENGKFIYSLGQGSNYNVIGDVIQLSNKTVSNFSTSNYIELPAIDLNSSNTWEIQLKFTTADIFLQQTLFEYDSPNKSICIGVSNRVSLDLSSDGENYNICSQLTGSSVLSGNTIYYIRLRFTGTSYILYLSTDDSNWSTEITVDSSDLIYENSQISRIGSGRTGRGVQFIGSVDLSECYIKTGSTIKWSYPDSTYNIVGNIVKNGITNFSESNYIELPNIDFHSASSWEMMFKFVRSFWVVGGEIFAYGNSDTTYEALSIEIDSSSKIHLNATSSTSSFTIANKSGNTILSTDTIYYIRVRYTGTKYTVELSTNLQNWVTEISVDSTLRVYSGSITRIGREVRTSEIESLNGFIDLSESYINLNGSYTWGHIKMIEDSGITDVQPNTTYYIKEVFMGSSNEILYSTDNSTWVSDYSLTNNIPAYSNNPIYVGINSSQNDSFAGSIDLGNTCITSDNSAAYKPLILYKGEGSLSVSPNTTYYIKEVFNGSNHIFRYSTNGSTWSIDYSLSNNNPIYSNNKFYGGDDSNNTYPFNGSIDLLNTEIKANGETIWSKGLNSITLPPCTIYSPFGRDENDNVKSRKYKLSGGTYLINSLNDSMEITENTSGEFPVFFNTSTGTVQVAKNYSKWTDVEPLGSEIGDVWYKLDNFMYHTATVGANFIPSETVNVTNEGVITGLGYLNLIKNLPISNSPEWNTCFTTGSDVTTLQNLWSLPYTVANIKEGNMNIDVYSYAYEVTFTSVVYSGSYTLDDSSYSFTVNAGGEITLYTDAYPAYGTELYSDASLETLYAKVIDSNISESSISFYTISSSTSTTFTGGSSTVVGEDTIYTYTINGTDTVYTKNRELVTDTDTLIYSDFECETYYGFATNVTGSNVTINTTYQNIAMDNYSSVCEYTMGSDTYYTVEPLAENVSVYSDATLETLFGIVSSVSSGSCIILSASEELGYVEYYGDSGEFVPPSIELPGSLSPSPISIYEDTNLTTVNTTSTGNNAIYTGLYYTSIMHTFSIPVSTSTKYVVNLTFNQSTDESLSELILTVNDTSYTQACNIRRINNITDYLQLGGPEGFSGTLYLRNPDNISANITYLTNSWEWNGHIDEFADWEISNLAELGFITIDSGKITDFKMNHALELAKVEDLKSLTVKASETDIYTKIGDPIFTFSNEIDTDKEIWLRGQTVSRIEYSKLFEIYGTIFGEGDGVSTFKLPNFTNKTIWGSDSSLGEIEAGLPDITGSISACEIVYKSGYTPPARGAFYRIDGNANVVSGEAKNTVFDNDVWFFSASRSNSIYGKSTTVQPPSIKIYVKTRYK